MAQKLSEEQDKQLSLKVFAIVKRARELNSTSFLEQALIVEIRDLITSFLTEIAIQEREQAVREYFKFEIGQIVFLLDESTIVTGKIFARKLEVSDGDWEYSGSRVIKSSVPAQEQYEWYKVEYSNAHTTTIRHILVKNLFSSKQELLEKLSGAKLTGEGK